ncbi:5161_t:CDS:1, partial [Acaulospora morrowiae]
MRNLLIILFVALSTIFLLADSKSTTGDRVLVLLDRGGDKKSYSQFFKILE